MDGRQDPQIDTEIKKGQAPAVKAEDAGKDGGDGAELKLAKDRLREQAGRLTLREYGVKHPYLSLGAAFFGGVLLGGSHEARGDLAYLAAAAIGGELLRQLRKQ